MERRYDARGRQLGMDERGNETGGFIDRVSAAGVAADRAAMQARAAVDLDMWAERRAAAARTRDAHTRQVLERREREEPNDTLVARRLSGEACTVTFPKGDLGALHEAVARATGFPAGTFDVYSGAERLPRAGYTDSRFQSAGTAHIVTSRMA
jgi:hypothetical protein